ncbi:Pre-mRNA-splicing factor ATP-dependent RNA helicase [Sarcoptes scabiei]|nr:Pre-mRNA-splicing factor ATP-dependent RNA helicase [Sarcoptes scabiei]
MAFTEHGDYIKIFRMAYLKTSIPSDLLKPMILSTRIFLPSKQNDTINILLQQISDWINYRYDGIFHSDNRSTKAKKLIGPSHTIDVVDGGMRKQDRTLRLISAQTVSVFTKDFGNSCRSDIEKYANNNTFLANRFGSKNAYLFFSFRLFFNALSSSRSQSSPSSSIYTRSLQSTESLSTELSSLSLSAQKTETSNTEKNEE